MMKGAAGLTSRLIAHHTVGLVGGCSAGTEVLAVRVELLTSTVYTVGAILASSPGCGAV